MVLDVGVYCIRKYVACSPYDAFCHEVCFGPDSMTELHSQLVSSVGVEERAARL